MHSSNDSHLGHARRTGQPEQASASTAPGPSALDRTASSPPPTSSSRYIPAHPRQIEPLSPPSSTSAALPQTDSSPLSDFVPHAPPLSRTASMQSSQDEVLIAIKCPSLDRDSILIKAPLDASILHVKQIIERTWRGAPKAHGMRCIRAGRLLHDYDLLQEMTVSLQQNEPLSLHLVIRPDAWSDPQNRPTSSRRTSYIRQQAARDPLLNTQETTAPILAEMVSNVTSAFSAPQFAPYFSEPVKRFTPQEDIAELHNRTNGTFDREAAAACSRIEQTIRVTAPENYPILTDALLKAHDEYLILYEDIYAAAFQEQRVGELAPVTPSPPRNVLDLVEGPLFGWSPITINADRMEGDTDTESEATHYYRQITHQGLPYLLRVTSTSLALQRSSALSQLLIRMSALRIMLQKIDNLVLLGSFVQQPTPQPSPSSTPNAPANQLRTRIDYLRIMLHTTRAGLGHVTMQDLAEVAVHVFFLVLRVSILLYIVVRHADPLKKFFVLGMTGVYVAFESWRILLRRIRARQPAPPINRPATPIPPPADHRADAAPAGPDAPAGRNVPRASADEEELDRQVAEEPTRPLPPPRLPARHRAASTLTLDYLMEYMSYVGLDIEDAQLGLLPASAPQSQTAPYPNQGWWHAAYCNVALPVLLFFFTMVPEVEQRRKRAIEERERVIRKWTRLEQERKQNLRQQQQNSSNGAGPVPETASNSASTTAVAENELDGRRKAYADQIIRRRTGGGIVAGPAADNAVDAEDEDAIQRALQGQGDDDELELNFF